MSTAAPAMSDYTVLVVDDDTAERQTLRAMIAAEGYTVDDVGGGLEALEALRQSPVNLVLTDLFMSGVDGWELVKSIKSDYPKTHVVVLSGNVSVQGEQVLLSRRIDGYLVKPVRPRLLQILFKALLLPGGLDRPADTLVVEKDRKLIDAMEQALGELGVYSTVFDDVHKAMHSITADPPNLLVTELVLGRQSGFELIEDVRRSRHLPYIPILAVTTAPSRNQIRRAADLHVNGILGKPVDIERFKERALKLVAQGTTARV